MKDVLKQKIMGSIAANKMQILKLEGSIAAYEAVLNEPEETESEEGGAVAVSSDSDFVTPDVAQPADSQAGEAGQVWCPVACGYVDAVTSGT